MAKPRPPRAKSFLGVSLPPGLLALLRAEAGRETRTVSNMVEIILEARYARQEKEENQQ